MKSEDRIASEIQGFLELALGRKARFYCGWHLDEANAGFVTSEADKQRVICWLQRTIEVLRGTELLEVKGPNG
jgi:hypothetical protein